MIIYKITNLINGKIYIGKDSRNNPNYYGSGIVINHAIKKYGKNNFIKEILCKCSSKEELNEKEIYWIKYFNSTDINIGYNRTNGGDGASGGLLPETIEKIVRKNTGKKRTLEQKKRMSLASKGIAKSDNHKKSLSKAWKKRKIEKPTTKETLEKKRKSMKGKNVGKYIKIYEFKAPDGNIIQTTEGLVKFCKSIHKHPQVFRELIQGKRKEYHNWTYIKTIKE